MRVPKRTGRTSTTSSVVNSYVSSDIQPTTLSRSSSVSFDNPSIDGSSINDENQPTNPRPIVNESLSLLPPTPALSSSLSELDPMWNGRTRTPSPLPSTLTPEPAINDFVDSPLVTIDPVLEYKPVVEGSPLPSPALSIDQASNESTAERMNEELLHVTEEDTLDLE